MTTKPPNYYIDRAKFHRQREEWDLVVAAYNSAIARTVGHNRRARYETWRDAVLASHAIRNPHAFYPKEETK